MVEKKQKQEGLNNETKEDPTTAYKKKAAFKRKTITSSLQQVIHVLQLCVINVAPPRRKFQVIVAWFI